MATPIAKKAGNIHQGLAFSFRNMSARQRDWARRKRAALMGELGGLFPSCAECGVTDDLQFDVVIPADNDTHHKMEWSQRMSFYVKQFRMNNLQILCGRCNAIKGTVQDRQFHAMREQSQDSF